MSAPVIPFQSAVDGALGTVVNLLGDGLSSLLGQEKRHNQSQTDGGHEAGEDDAGAHADAEDQGLGSLKALLQRLDELKKGADATVAAADEEARRAKERVDAAREKINAAIEKLKDKQKRGEDITPADLDAARKLVTDELQSVQQDLEKLNAAVKKAAQRTAELADLHNELATDNAVDNGVDGGGWDRSLLPDPEPAPPNPERQHAAPTGFMPGMAPGMPGFPMPGFPSMGGGPGGMPGLSDPLSALTGLGQHGDAGLGLKDKPPLDDAADGKEIGLHDDEGGDKDVDTDKGAEKVSDEGGEAGDEGAQTTPAANDEAPAGPPPPTTEVQLRDGQTVEARTAQSAEAVRGVLAGASVSEGYQQAGITLPPPGTPVTEPLPPTQLKAGDLGVWKDHMVMALGGNKVLVSGQVQPLDSVSSGPDFLGWIDPTGVGVGRP